MYISHFSIYRQVSTVMISNILIAIACVSIVAAHTEYYRNESYLAAYFDPKYSGGVSGVAKIIYPSHGSPMSAHMFVDMDMSKLDMNRIKEVYPNCGSYEPTFGWHMHAIWHNEFDSAFIEGCSPAQTGGHYDPTFACGPASQYVNDPICKAKLAQVSYSCTQSTYKKDAISCEKGDLGGKFGPLEADKDGLIKSYYYDYFFPAAYLFNQPVYNEKNVQWNFLLHLACPEHNNPRLVCARFMESK